MPKGSRLGSGRTSHLEPRLLYFKVKLVPSTGCTIIIGGYTCEVSPELLSVGHSSTPWVVALLPAGGQWSNKKQFISRLRHTAGDEEGLKGWDAGQKHCVG